jgi:hypothetical protein
MVNSIKRVVPSGIYGWGLPGKTGETWNENNVLYLDRVWVQKVYASVKIDECTLKMCPFHLI